MIINQVVYYACIAAVAERKPSSRMLRQCQPASQQAEKPSCQRPAMLVNCHFISLNYQPRTYRNKCTKHQFIHLLTATFKDLHIENSKNYKR